MAHEYIVSSAHQLCRCVDLSQIKDLIVYNPWRDPEFVRLLLHNYRYNRPYHSAGHDNTPSMLLAIPLYLAAIVYAYIRAHLAEITFGLMFIAVLLIGMEWLKRHDEKCRIKDQPVQPKNDVPVE